MGKLVLGLDFGTNSVRGLLGDADSGEQVALATSVYGTGDQGIHLSSDPLLARQRPADYLQGVLDVCAKLREDADLASVVGIGVDVTASTPMPVDQQNRSLADRQEFASNLNAYAWLWKDHTAHQEAREISELCREMELPYLTTCGGEYSSEWFWSKILRCLRMDPEVSAAAYSWVEACDWIPSQLCGIQNANQIVRSRCGAGHKGMFEETWGGLPSAEFLGRLHPQLPELRGRLFDEVQTSDQPAGELSSHYAQLTGIPAGIPVAVGMIDAHAGAVGAGVTHKTLVKIMGTSTCDCLVHPLDDELPMIPGISGIVRGSIIPGFFGLEAGQAAVGDCFRWVSEFSGKSHEELTAEAAALDPGECGLLALDWLNGNRCVLANSLLSGTIVGLTLHSKPHEVYRAMIEATAFGARKILERFEQYGVRVERIIACGGIADKSDLVLQIYADVLNRPVQVAASQESCALGAAICGGVAAGVFADFTVAQERLCKTKSPAHTPQPDAVATYAALYSLYTRLHDAFGGVGTAELAGFMEDLAAMRQSATSP